MGKIEEIKLKRAASMFSEAMKTRLLSKLREDQYHGWNDPAEVPTASLLQKASKDLEALWKGFYTDPEHAAELCVDIANRAMMIYYRSLKNE